MSYNPVVAAGPTPTQNVHHNPKPGDARNYNYNYKTIVFSRKASLTAPLPVGSVRCGTHSPYVTDLVLPMNFNHRCDESKERENSHILFFTFFSGLAVRWMLDGMKITTVDGLRWTVWSTANKKQKKTKNKKKANKTDAKCVK
jgi:hypothetical protein